MAVSAVAAALAVAGSATDAGAQAGSTVERAVAALERDNVYVDPSAEEALSASEADALRDRIGDADAGAVYVAVLPEAAAAEAGGTASGVANAIGGALEENGTYVALVGDDLGAQSTRLGGGEADELAAEAERAGGHGAAMLASFVDRLAQADNSGGGLGGGLVLVLLVALFAGLAFVVFRTRRRRHAAAADLAEVKAAAQEDLLALADGIRELDLDVEMPGANENARTDYERALTMYERADAALDRAREPENLAEVSAAVEEGRHAIASAKARLEGREPPVRRPPCFIDPRHGPSYREVEWAPPWGAPRLIPVCEADAQRIERGLEPAPREVSAGGRRVPYWDAPPAYGPWAGGFFGGFGGLFPGLFFGSMLGAAFMPPVILETGEAGDEGGGDGDSEGGDADGGDFGDGDFGGGDFGGGDFGGGDF